MSDNEKHVHETFTLQKQTSDNVNGKPTQVPDIHGKPLPNSATPVKNEGTDK